MKFVVKLGGVALEDPQAPATSAGKAIFDLVQRWQPGRRRPRRRRPAHPHPRPDGQEKRVRLRPARH